MRPEGDVRVVATPSVPTAVTRQLICLPRSMRLTRYVLDVARAIERPLRRHW